MAQPKSTKAQRWLLPFTTEVDLPAIDAALHLAEAGGSTLVAISFLVTPSGRKTQRVRPELLQQSQDFLEAVRYKAQRLAFPVECHEVVTNDLLLEITRQMQHLECRSIVLASKGKYALFLSRQEMQELVFNPPAQLFLLRFSSETSLAQSGLIHRFLSWVHRLSRMDIRSPSATTVPVSLHQNRQEILVSQKEA